MLRQSKVMEGQVYADLPRNRPGSRLWKVDRLCENVMDVPHARLCDVRDPCTTKTISCSALTSQAYYVLIADPSAANN